MAHLLLDAKKRYPEVERRCEEEERKLEEARRRRGRTQI